MQAIDIVFDALKAENLQVFKITSTTKNYPFIILNTAFGITFPTLRNPANRVGEGIKIDFYSKSADELYELYNQVHLALERSKKMIDFVTQFTFEEDATPNSTKRMTAIYRIRTN